MARSMIVVRSPASDPAARDVEIVERKGLGHPDTICDALAEEISSSLSQHYIQRFGRILHHNVDKILLVGGAARPTFGGGEIIQPIEIYLAGRATSVYGNESTPVDDIALDACRRWLRQYVPNLDVDRGVRITSRIRPGSVDLAALFEREAASPLANDTSIGCGFAPFTELERVVLEVERTLNGPAARDDCPAIGQDIKVMGIRHGSEISLTIACAFVDRYTANLDAYIVHKTHVEHVAREAAGRVTGLPVKVVVNRADDLARGSIYLTVTGTSAEAGDDGEVGRGNRTSGLITPYRVMSTEAAAGKNPLTHVGKLYNVMASRIAASLVETVAGVTAADCILVSEIGRKVDDPAIVDVAISGLSMSNQLRTIVADVVNQQTFHVADLTEALLQRRMTVF
jgi:S-adenosylmethionine synthetase